MCKYCEIDILSNEAKRNIRKNQINRVFHSYKCRKCGWESINFDE